MGEGSPTANKAQAQRWNGASGEHWIEHRERHIAEHYYLTPHLFRSASIAPGERVLDVGCGCGDTTIAAARAAAVTPGGSAVGLDLSAPMLAVARQLAAQADTANVSFIQGDAQACPLRRGSVDVIISNFGVMFFEDPDAAFASLAAVVRPRGRLAFLCWQGDSSNQVFAIPQRAFRPYAQFPAPANGDLFARPRRIKALLSGAGWDDVRVTPVIEPAWQGKDVDDVMGYIRGMPMMSNVLASVDDPLLSEQVLAAVAAQYSALQQPDGIWVQAAAWLVTAHRS